MGDVLEFLPVQSTSSISDKKLDVRVLTPGEVATLQPDFEMAGAIIPDPAASFAVGAMDGQGKVVAFLFFQLQIHAEPLKIEHGNEAIFSRLIDVGEKELVSRCGPRLVYAFTPAGKVTKLAQLAGMQIEPWVVMSKVCGLPEVVQ